jgi:hypothetical protein
VIATPTADVLGELAREVARGRLVVPIVRTHPLAEVPLGLAEFSANEKLGKVAITI